MNLRQIPRPPQNFNPRQIALWRQACQALLDQGRLADVDRSLIEAYARLGARYLELEEQIEGELAIKDDGSANQIHGMVARVSNSWIAIAAKLGILPTSENRENPDRSSGAEESWIKAVS